MNRSKAWSASSGGQARAVVVHRDRARRRAWSRRETVTVVPGGVWWRALPSRLVTTWCRRWSSPVTVDRLLGQVEPPAVVGGQHAGVADRLQQQPGQVDLGALERASGVQPGEQQQVVDQRGHPLGLGLDLRQRGGERRAGRPAYDGTARRTRGSWPAGCAARGRRRRRTGAPAARCGGGRRESVSTWASRVLSAEPTWPTSVRSSVRCSGTRSVTPMSPDSSGSSATACAVAATSCSGRSWRRTTNVPASPAAATPSKPDEHLPARSGSRGCPSTPVVGRPVTIVPPFTCLATTTR